MAEQLILIVDDEKPIVDILKFNLKKEGFELVDYTNGTWTFMNKTECLLTFDNNKVAYSNKLCF